MPTEKLTQASFARRVGTTRQTIHGYTQRGLPTDKDGRISEREGLAWLRQNIGGWDEGSGKENPGVESLTEARRRKEASLADTYELELKIRRGELLEADRVNRWICSMIQAARDEWLRLPGELQVYVGIENAELLRKRIEAALHKLSTFKGEFYE